MLKIFIYFTFHFVTVRYLYFSCAIHINPFARLIDQLINLINYPLITHNPRIIFNYLSLVPFYFVSIDTLK